MMPDTIKAAKATATRHVATFAAGRTQYDALAPYATADELLDALRPTSPLDAAARDAIVTALLVEHRRTGHPLWQSLLLAAFEPMLARLRYKLGARDDEDVDQRVLLAFLAALRVARTGPYATLSLRWATLDEIKATVRAERREGPRLPSFDEAEHGYDVFGVDQHARTAVAEVARIVEEHGGEDLLGALLATHGVEESLASYVRRTYAGESEKALASRYDRLSRARLSALAELRAKLARRAA